MSIKDMILLALSNLGGESYGLPLYEEIQRIDKRFCVRFHSMTMNLITLEKMDYITAESRSSSPEIANKVRKFYLMTDAGFAHLNEIRNF